jgi:hypothetical protein
MTWRGTASLVVALLCAGCAHPPAGDAARLAYEGVPNPWFVVHVQNTDGRYLDAYYDPRPLGQELCLAARIHIPIEVKHGAIVQETEWESLIAYSSCEKARPAQFGWIWPGKVHLFSGEELQAAFLDVAAVIAHGSHAVPGVTVAPWSDACDLKPEAKLENLGSAYEYRSSSQSDGQIDIVFMEDKTTPEYDGAVIPLNFGTHFQVFFKEHRVTEIMVDPASNTPLDGCHYAHLRSNAP